MKWPKNKSVRSGFTTSVIIIIITLLILSCHTKKSVVEESMTLNEWFTMNLDTSDTLYLPWQLWTIDTVPPLPIIKHTSQHAQVTHNVERSDTTTKQSDISFHGLEQSPQIPILFSYGFFLVLGIVFCVLIVAVMRRL